MSKFDYENGYAEGRRAYKEELVTKVEGLYHKPYLYHYRCWASGSVLVRDEWGKEPLYKCHSYDGDFNCGCRRCPWVGGLIKGQLELQEFEKHENQMLSKVVSLLQLDQRTTTTSTSNNSSKLSQVEEGG